MSYRDLCVYTNLYIYVYVCTGANGYVCGCVGCHLRSGRKNVNRIVCYFSTVPGTLSLGTVDPVQQLNEWVSNKMGYSTRWLKCTRQR